MIAGFRRDMPQMYLAMGAGVIVASFYYVAASLIFPADDTDLNEHYFRHKRKILALVVAVNLPVMAYQIRHWPLVIYVVSGLWLLLAAMVIAARGKSVNYAALGSLLALYVYMYVGR
jgi:hypothetical protein